MTIAACHLSTEGVVLGADSTTTMFVASPGNAGGSDHHYNFAQKIFEIGEHSTAGVVLWGLGSLGDTSYRTLVAEVADTAIGERASSLEAVAGIWAQSFWAKYDATFGQYLSRARSLHSKSQRTAEEDTELLRLSLLFSGGFCIGGRWGASRRPTAYEVQFGPMLTNAPTPQSIGPGHTRFWGCPNLIERLIYGIDGHLFAGIVSSDKWTGTQDDLYGLVSQNMLAQPLDLPLREAVDWVYSSIYTTIKAMKFSHLAPVCGGPIEVAVVTSDRPFRWVRHKELDEAIS